MPSILFGCGLAENTRSFLSGHFCENARRRLDSVPIPFLGIFVLEEEARRWLGSDSFPWDFLNPVLGLFFSFFKFFLGFFFANSRLRIEASNQGTGLMVGPGICAVFAPELI